MGRGWRSHTPKSKAERQALKRRRRVQGYAKRLIMPVLISQYFAGSKGKLTNWGKAEPDSL